MTFTELKEKANILKNAYIAQIRELRKEYAIEHNPIKVGDIITDHYHTIKVESMVVYVESYYYTNNIPYIRYKGVELTKKGVPKKHQQYTTMAQPDIKTINKKPYKYFEEV